MVATSARIVRVVNLGRVSFQHAYNVQTDIVATHRNEGRNGSACRDLVDTLLLLEHEPVYTVGIRTKDYPLEEEVRLKSLGADFVRSNRGGLITFHGPGQLVAYPVINLGHFHKTKSIRWYVGQLEHTAVELCHKFGIRATTSSDTGVWISDKKIAAIGVHGSRYITTHGIAINCNVDLEWFTHIVPCGLKDKGVTSLTEQLERHVTVQETVPHFLESFKQHFECELIMDNKPSPQNKSTQKQNTDIDHGTTSAHV